jgi:hypothetical protein
MRPSSGLHRRVMTIIRARFEGLLRARIRNQDE